MTSNKGPFLAIWEHDLLISCSNNSLQACSLQAAIYICTLFQPYSKQMCPQWGSSTDHFIGQRYTWHSACLGILPGLLHNISESRHFLSAKEICANNNIPLCKHTVWAEAAKWVQGQEFEGKRYKRSIFLYIVVFIVSVHHSCTREDATCNPGSFSSHGCQPLCSPLHSLFHRDSKSRLKPRSHCTPKSSDDCTVLPVL